MSRTIAAILLVAVLALGGGLITVTAYQAGLGIAVTTAVAEGGGPVVTVPAGAYGWGYGPGPGFGWHGAGFGFFGFLGTLLFVFLVVALMRAVFFHRGPGHRGGWGPGWGDGPGGRRAFWESRFGEGFDEWHRQAHGGESPTGPSGPNSNPPSKPA
jgi:hypothetical protein